MLIVFAALKANTEDVGVLYCIIRLYDIVYLHVPIWSNMNVHNI